MYFEYNPGIHLYNNLTFVKRTCGMKNTKTTLAKYSYVAAITFILIRK